jgi:hypothetical protein
MKYRLNGPDVIQELMDDEVIVVHLVSGSYYSMAGSALVIWQMLVAGLSPAAIAERLVGVSASDLSDLRRMVDDFVAQLVSESLVAPTVDGARDEVPAALPQPTERAPLAVPVLSKYTDMNELLLLDPIHEVDPMGWPSRNRTAQ